MRVSPLPNYLSLKWLTSDCAASTISKSLLKGFSLSLSLDWPGNSLGISRRKVWKTLMFPQHYFR